MLSRNNTDSNQTGSTLEKSHLFMAAAKIPMLVSLGGIEEWPGTVDTLSLTVA